MEVEGLAWFTQHHEVTVLSPAKAPRTLVSEASSLRILFPSELQVTRKRESWE